MNTIAERVAAGAAFLDEREPDWWRRIDVKRLELASSCQCVLGQLHSHKCGEPSMHYLHARSRFEVADVCGHADPDAALGFDVSDAARRAGREGVEYAGLTAEWRRVIAERQAVKAGAVA